jgi:hypothetical protein
MDKNRRMNRGLNQSLYKYLPGIWIDFYHQGISEGFTAMVKSWNCYPLENINEERVLAKVESEVRSFEKFNGGIKEFGPSIDPETYKILVPKCGENPDIFAQLDPQLFVCSNVKCNKLHSVKSDTYLSNYRSRLCNACGGKLKQLNFAYACKCGWGGGITSIPCSVKAHGFSQMVYTGDFKFKCKICGKPREIVKFCPECNKQLYVKNALDWSRFIPKSFKMVDFIDKDIDQFLAEDEDAQEIIMSHWVGILSDQEYYNCLKGRSKEHSPEEYRLKIESYMKSLESVIVDVLGREAAAINIYNDEYGNVELSSAINDIKQSVTSILSSDPSLNQTVSVERKKELLEEKYGLISNQILEYNKIKNAKEVTSIDGAIKIARMLNATANPENYNNIASAYGIKSAQACGEVDFVSITYGYTRVKTDDPEVNLRAFPPEVKKMKNVYGNKLLTEGILIEFDREKILDWLVKNFPVLSEKISINYKIANNEGIIKKWFLDNINLNLIERFDEIRDDLGFTKEIYKLIHSISHTLIIQASKLSGLGKDSLGEYIMPAIPATFIYCQNNQGNEIGALFNLFEAYFDKWLVTAKDDIEKCVFDPICLDRDEACSGCLFLNDISCNHSNKDLSRRYLIGWQDNDTGEEIQGFWEGI